MKLSEMKQILAEGGIQLTKSLGQNFLHDANQLRRIVAAAELSPEDKVLEIGPGLGPLTEVLLEQAGQVLAIEKDARLVAVLRDRLAGSTRLQLVHGDALDLLKHETRDWSEWKLVANLPYSVASPILVELAQAALGPRRMVATLQIEVAKRLVAARGSEYGVLSLLVQLDYEPRGWFKIPSGCFFPAPEVDSACVCLVRRPRSWLTPPERERFVRLVKRGFSQRRKMMRKLLKAEWPPDQVDRAWESLGEPRVSPEARAETVTLEQFVRLTRALAPDSGA